jgi:hypothetical protein
MFSRLGRVLLVGLLLASLAFSETRSSPIPLQSSSKTRYVLLAVAYRQQVQEKIDAPLLVTTILPTSLFSMWADMLGRLNGTVMSGWLVPSGDPVLGSVSLQI